MPNSNWAFQVSHGFLRSPENQEPDVDIRRTTASVQYNKPFNRGHWASTFVWGRNQQYNVAWVETKQRASKKLSEGVWDLVIMDINLPVARVSIWPDRLSVLPELLENVVVVKMLASTAAA
jgi:CheY-like chemotaxis protein